jgi:hypothetical protein
MGKRGDAIPADLSEIGCAATLALRYVMRNMMCSALERRPSSANAEPGSARPPASACRFVSHSADSDRPKETNRRRIQGFFIVNDLVEQPLMLIKVCYIIQQRLLLDEFHRSGWGFGGASVLLLMLELEQHDLLALDRFFDILLNIPYQFRCSY